MSREVELDITGMTCASCSARIEKKLSRLDGVTAEVNLPLETAHVVIDSDLHDDEITAAVAKAGYGATVRGPAGGSEGSWDSGNSDDSGPEIVDYDPRHLRPRFIGSLILAVPIVAISMVMGWHFAGWQWVAAILALPVVTWGAWPFHTAAFKAARGGSTTMDTLVSVGIIVASGYSYCHFGPGARRRLRVERARRVPRVVRGGRGDHGVPAHRQAHRGSREDPGHRRTQGAARPRREVRDRAAGRGR
jgi:Cu+-exporting ATPase